jgi:hypothetical protein
MPGMNEPELTVIGGREITAFNARGQTTTVDLLCERIGPPPRAVTPLPSTTFVVTLRRLPHEAGDSASGIDIRQEAHSLWDALLEARVTLEEAGWLLPIAAARRDWWCTYAERRFDVTVVHPLADLSQNEGMLQTIPHSEVATVSEQRQAHQRWVDGQTARKAAQ